jgi:hypothetical protein
MLTLRPNHALLITLVALVSPPVARCDPLTPIQKVCSDATVTAFVAEAASLCFVRRVTGSKTEKARHHPVLHEPLAMGEIIECIQTGATLLITNCNGREDKRLTPADMRDGGYPVPSVSPREPDDDADAKRAARSALNLPGTATPGRETTSPGTNAGHSVAVGADSGRTGSDHAAIFHGNAYDTGQLHGGSPSGGAHPGETAGWTEARESDAVARGPTRSWTFTLYQRPVGGGELHAANGIVIRTRSDGSRADIHDAQRRMSIHHGLDGSRSVIVERADHSRVVVGRSYGMVQRPYMFHGNELAQRTYVVHGRAYSRLYARFLYHGVSLEVYAPTQYYPVGFYSWANKPWPSSVTYSWGWTSDPWYSYYGFYFAPFLTYPNPDYWQTDFLLAQTLQSAYSTQIGAYSAQAAFGPETAAPVSAPELKEQIAAEVRSEVQQESLAAQANAVDPHAVPTYRGVAALLEDGHSHLLVVGRDLDVVDASGRECALTSGDVVQVRGPPAPDAINAYATVLASKGALECARSARVTVALTDLQEMHNHMRETIDQGLEELRTKQGTDGLPPLPVDASAAPISAGFASGAPPPDANAATEITAQSHAAERAEREDVEIAAAARRIGEPPPTVALGQSPDQVTAALGTPTRILDLGTKKIYAYRDLKIIFTNGKVSDVE